MNQLSLKSRQLIIFVGIVVILLPIILLSIEQAFKKSQVTALEQQLEANLYTIIGELELDTAQVNISTQLLAPILNQVDSGTLAIVEQDGELVWHSDSALGKNPIISQKPSSPGKPLFVFEANYWRMSYSLFFESEMGRQNLTVHVMQHEQILAEQVSQFRAIIVFWFAIVAIMLLLAIALALWSTLVPINRLDDQIKQVEKGQSQFIKGEYPKELARVKEDLNLLIAAQDRQKNRYRSSLSDLTHALKTPVAVLRSSKVCDDPAVIEQLDRITNIIEHQLRRAATAGEDVWKKKTAIAPILDKMLTVMTKIHRDKDIQFSRQLSDNGFFYGDEADLMEILGNLIDNACKACQQQVHISTNNRQGLSLIVEDDGPGIKAHQKQQLLIRGQRLDTYQDGHGVGMAIVNDLVKSYKGELQIQDSTLGGAKFVVHFASQSRLV